MQGFLYKSKKAFTLIEIMTVITILGIMMTLAVPQYQMVVEKMRSAEGIRIITVLREAQQRYALENDGAYTNDLNDLDVTIPASAYFDSPVVLVNGDASIDRNGSDPYDYSLTITAAGGLSCSEGGGSGSICSNLGF